MRTYLDLFVYTDIRVGYAEISVGYIETHVASTEIYRGISIYLAILRYL